MHAANIVGAQGELAGASRSDGDGGEGLQPRQALGSNRVSPFGEASLSCIPCCRAVCDSPCAPDMRGCPPPLPAPGRRAAVASGSSLETKGPSAPLLPGLGLIWRSCSSLNTLQLEGGHSAVYYGFFD